MKVHLLFSFVATASALSYELAATLPWTPKNATSVDQSTVYNDTYYLADRTNSAVHVIDIATNEEKAPITGFKGLSIRNNKPDSATSAPTASSSCLTATNCTWVTQTDSFESSICLKTESWPTSRPTRRPARMSLPTIRKPIRSW